MPAHPHVKPIRSIPATAIIALLALATGCAASRTDPNLPLRHALDAMRRSHDADTLAAAAVIDLFLHGKPGAPDFAGRLQLIEQAGALAPGRPDIAWLAVQACRPVSGCDPVPFEMRLRVLDPGNGTGWLGALDRAYHTHDDVALDGLVAEVGRRDRVDIYWTPLASRLTAALAATHEVSQRTALLTVIGSLAAIAVPEYQSSSKVCQGERLQRSGVLEACRALAESFERGDSLVTAGLGTAIEKRLWPEGSPDWNRVVAQRRLIHYWLQMANRYVAPDWDSSTGRAFAQLLAAHTREQDVFIAALTAHGIPPNPPDSWIDDSPS